MRLTIDVPVPFTTDATHGGTRTALTFITTEFEIRQADEETAPMVGKVFHQYETMESAYRVHEGTLYGCRQLVDGRRSPPNIECDLTRLIGEHVAQEIQDLRIDDLLPRDAKDLMALVSLQSRTPVKDYEEYRKLVAGKIRNRKMSDLAMASPDFELRREHAVAFLKNAISELLLVDGVRYSKTQGLAIKVDLDWNKQVIVSTMEMWSGSKWRQRPGSVMLSNDDARSHFFAYADRDQAISFAESMGEQLDRSVHVKEDVLARFANDTDLPKQNMVWSELFRSASVVADRIGFELARRIKNQEGSIFTDDRSMRYAFDELMEGLEIADPFGEPDERVELAARGVLNIVRADPRLIDARYRNLATSWAMLFDHLEVVLARWDERPMEIKVSYRQLGLPR
jgi:hypothetical protein